MTENKLFQDPRQAVHLGLGAASPLWATFLAAASAGVAFWAWFQWGRGKPAAPAAAPEAVDAAAPPAATAGTPTAERPTSEPEPEPEPEAKAEPEAEAASIVDDTAAERIAESVAVQAPAAPA